MALRVGSRGPAVELAHEPGLPDTSVKGGPVHGRSQHGRLGLPALLAVKNQLRTEADKGNPTV